MSDESRRKTKDFPHSILVLGSEILEKPSIFQGALQHHRQFLKKLRLAFQYLPSASKAVCKHTNNQTNFPISPLNYVKLLQNLATVGQRNLATVRQFNIHIMPINMSIKPTKNRADNTMNEGSKLHMRKHKCHLYFPIQKLYNEIII